MGTQVRGFVLENTAATEKRSVHRSTKEERTHGLITAFRVIIADAFHSAKESPCRQTDVRDAVAITLGYSGSEFNKLSDRWSQWLRGLPKSSGRIRPEEADVANEWLGSRGYLPDELLVRLNDIVPDATFWSQCATFGTTPNDLAKMRDCFGAPAEAYHIFRYTIGDPGRIAVGQLTIHANPDTGVITTYEKYKVRGHIQEFSGYFLQQSDGVYRIFALHHGTGEVQVIQFRNLSTYTGQMHPELKGHAKRMIGTFLDRHDQGFFYTGKIIIRRIDRHNHRLPIDTISENTLKEYDPTIWDDLQMHTEPLYKNLFTFRI